MPQCPAPQPNGLPYWDKGDDDVLDITPIVYPPALLPAQAEHQTPPPAGRQRQYASNAEKQAAYRQRQKQRRAAQRGA